MEMHQIKLLPNVFFEEDFGEFGSNCDCWLSEMMTEKEADDFIMKYISER